MHVLHTCCRGRLLILVFMVIVSSIGAVERPKPAPVVSAEQAWRSGWPNYFGPNHTLCAEQSGQKLVGHYKEMRHLWTSETRVPQSKAANAADLPRHAVDGRWVMHGGASMPVVADGRLYQHFYRPHDTRFDQSFRYANCRGNSGLTQTYEQREQMERNGTWTEGYMGAKEVMVCMDAATGKTLWRRQFSGAAYLTASKDPACTHHPCVADGKVFMVDSAYRLYAMDAQSGEVEWVGRTKDNIPAQENLNYGRVVVQRAAVGGGAEGGGHGTDIQVLFVLDDLVYCNVNRGGLEAFDVKTGQARWQRLDISVAPGPRVWSHAGQHYLLCRGRNRLLCLHAGTGEQVWDFPLRSTSKEVGVRSHSTYFGVSGDVLALQTWVYDSVNKKARSGKSEYQGFHLSLQGPKHIWTGPATTLRGERIFACRAQPMPDGSFFCGTGQGHGYRLDAVTGKELSKYVYIGLSDRGVRAPIALDEPLVYVRPGYASGQIVGNDQTDPKHYAHFSWSEFLPKEGRFWNSTYSFIYSYAYAAGILFQRGNKHVHAFDLRADPRPLPQLQILPTWAKELPEPVQSLASHYHKVRQKARADIEGMSASQRGQLTEAMIALVSSGDRLVQRDVLDLVLLDGFDAARIGTALFDAARQALATGRGEIAAQMAGILASCKADVVNDLLELAAKQLQADEPGHVRAACQTLAALGPAAESHAASVAGLVDDALITTALTAMSALAQMDSTGAQLPALLAQLDNKMDVRRFAAADAIAAMGTVANKAVPVLAAKLASMKERVYGYTSTNRMQKQEHFWARRLIVTLGHIGEAAVPVLNTLIVGLGEGNAAIRTYLLGCLAETGTAAMPLVMTWWKSGDKQKRSHAIRTVTYMTRQGKAIATIQPFIDAVEAEGITSLQLKIAVWRLLADPSDSQALAFLVERCTDTHISEAHRKTAMQHLSQLIVRPHLAFPDQARRDTSSLLVNLVAAGKANDLVAVQMKGMKRWLNAEAQAKIKQVTAGKKYPRFTKKEHTWW